MARTKNASNSADEGTAGQGTANANSRGQAGNAEDAGENVGNKGDTAQAKDGFWQTVTIDSIGYEVNYGSAGEFAKLLNECATDAVTDIPRAVNPVRYFFQCIHCGDKTFTNKMRLNRHRFLSQCPAIKDAAGNPGRLLPYPDQGRGQGKVSEMIRKGRAVDAEAKVVQKQVNKDVTAASKARVEPSKGKGSDGTAKGAPSKAKGSEGKAKVAPKQKESERQPKGMKRTATSPLSVEAVKKARPTRSQQCFEDTAEGSPKHKRSDKLVHMGEGDAGGKDSAEAPKQRRKSMRFTEDTPAAPRPQNIAESSDSEDSTGDFQVTGSRKKKLPGTEPATLPARTRSRTPQPESQSGANATDLVPPNSVQAHITRCKENKMSAAPRGDPIWAQTADAGAGKELAGQKKQQSLKRAPGGAKVSTVPVNSPKKDPKKQVKKGRKHVVVSEDSDDSDVKMLDSPASPEWTPESTGGDVPGNFPDEGREASPDDNFETLIENELAGDPVVEGTVFSPGAMEESTATLPLAPASSTPPPAPASSTPPPAPAPSPNKSATATPKKRTKTANHLAIVSWTGTYEGNHALHRFWLCGLGSPTPKMYQPGLTFFTNVRAQRLSREEREIRIAARVKADALPESRPPPKPPVTIQAPGLYHLLRIRPQLLDWSWEGQSEEEFKERFAESWQSGFFQAATKECVMWWSCEAKEEDYASVFELVGRTVNSVCHSVKYGKVPDDVQLLGAYLQYVKELAEYKKRSEAYAAELSADQERVVEDAVSEFRFQTRLKREAIVWDWCPIWLVLVDQKNILEKLPALPWSHNDEEALRVREIILAEPMYRIRPPPFVQVLRIALQNIFGRWRQMSCPIWGLSRSLVRTMCRRQRDIMIALSIFLFESHLRFSGMSGLEWDVVHTAVMKDAQLICEGKEDRVMDSVMGWLQNVRMRALQDLAREYPVAFRRCWTTTTPDTWGDQGQVWSKFLRMRENFDMGWVAEEAVPTWATRLKAKRAKILELVTSIETAIQEDEEAAWSQYRQSTMHQPVREEAETLHVSCTEAAPVAHDLCKKVQDDEGGNPASEVQAPMPEAVPCFLSQMQASVNVGDICTEDLDVGGLLASEVQDPTPEAVPCTLSQMQATMNVGDICTQDLDVGGLPAVNTPSTFIGIICREADSAKSSFEVVQNTPRNLVPEFTAIATQLTQTHTTEDYESDDGEGQQDAEVTEELESARRVRHSRSVTVPSPSTLERIDIRGAKFSILKTYVHFKIEELMSSLPRKGKGSEDIGTINFFGSDWESLPVPIEQIQDLQKGRRMVGQNVVELLCRRLWWSMPAETRGRVYIGSSFMQGPLGRAWDLHVEDALVRWGRQYLVPCRIYRTCPKPLEVLVPYVDSLHWSLFILTETRFMHLDSGGVHNEENHQEYASRLWKVWQLLHDPPLADSPAMEKVSVFRQRGNYECSFLVLRFIELYIRFLHSDDPDLGVTEANEMLSSELQCAVLPAAMQKNVIAAIADELSITSAWGLYEPPFRALYSASSSESSVDGQPS